ncbi:MAG: OmpA family protein [Okeania sp. SIO3I5]|uniref:OmpA family protein n=1 Tax=Okeania sp. SIO3I5 TaxID=2607805 RepID=UPI0013B981D1|nr:OmpA family protein [Okeania sp. SIO3I5]NEQ36011.1 OmpA family protein [Okeania sp. SIO3I5]
MSAEKKIDNQQVVGPTILAGCMGFMIICAWAFASPNAFKRPTIDVQLTENVDSENVDSQTEEIQVTETPETETNTTSTEPESSTTTIETEDTETITTATTTDRESEVNTETTTSSEQPTTETTETPTNTEAIQVTATSQPEPETPTSTTDIATTSQSQGKSLTQAKTLGQVKFGFNAVELSFPAEQTINGFISEIKEYDPNKVAIKVEGHTSRVGDAQLNQLISQDRADAVVKYLKGQNLLHQVVGEGVGYEQPLPGTDPAADINQRTVIILTPAN